MVNNMDPAYSPLGEPLALGADKFLLPPQTIPHIGDALTAAGISGNGTAVVVMTVRMWIKSIAPCAIRRRSSRQP
jgi:hypothetical protein